MSNRPYIIEFLGGPGSGKTTMAAQLFAHWKSKSVVCEFVREYAQELIFKGKRHILERQNQLKISAGQYTKYTDLQGMGYTLLISDTSLRLCTIYAPEKLKESIRDIVEVVESEFQIIRVFVQRRKNYQTKGRLQPEAEARELDDTIREACGPFDLVVPGDVSGFEYLLDYLENRLRGIL